MLFYLSDISASSFVSATQHQGGRKGPGLGVANRHEVRRRRPLEVKVGGLAVCLAAVVQKQKKPKGERSNGRFIQQGDDGGSAAAAVEEKRGGHTTSWSLQHPTTTAWLQLFSTSTLSFCALAALSHTLI